MKYDAPHEVDPCGAWSFLGSLRNTAEPVGRLTSGCSSPSGSGGAPSRPRACSTHPRDEPAVRDRPSVAQSGACGKSLPGLRPALRAVHRVPMGELVRLERTDLTPDGLLINTQIQEREAPNRADPARSPDRDHEQARAPVRHQDGQTVFRVFQRRFQRRDRPDDRDRPVPRPHDPPHLRLPPPRGRRGTRHALGDPRPLQRHNDTAVRSAQREGDPG